MAQVDERWRAVALAAIGDAGRRSGGARRSVVDLLAREHCCLTAQEISEQLHRDGERTGIASVYRALELLHAIGLVQRVEVGEGATRYESVAPGGEHHHHVLCESCGRLSAFEDERLEEAIERLAEQLEHDVRAHDILIRGECRGCQRRAGSGGKR